MHSARRFGFAALTLMLLAMVSAAAEYRFEDEEPEVTDRVARISFLKGDVQIKRSDSDDWERAVLNLPIVEGDELTTGPDSRFEIQFGAYSHLRVAEQSVLKVTALRENLVAVSLPEGALTATLARFDGDRESFEIDAPSTTVALLKQGRYRVSAGPAGYEAVRVSIAEEGEARIYSNNSGFSLHAGRTARIFVAGKYAGEFEHGDATQFLDSFDRWALDRDETIAKRQAKAYYGKYYDTDIYGADDLNDNGDWIFTRDYGYVWRPYNNVISGYADWSPYRYGSWRWVPGFGWAWVNDEPWAWATYHHGRWIWYNGSWHWAPYGYYRPSRSWWYPALVVVQVVNRNVCWYPLSYHHAYYNYNRNYHRNFRRNRDDRNNISGGRATLGSPREPSRPVVAINPPGNSVISVPLDDFGKRRGGYNKVPNELGRNIVALIPSTGDDMPQLPVMRDIRNGIGADIRIAVPKEPVRGTPISVGAASRGNDDGPLDKTLRGKFIYGDRPTVLPNVNTGSSDTPASSDSKTVRSTGAVGRPQSQPTDRDMKEPTRTITPIPRNDSPPLRPAPRDNEPQKVVTREPVKRDTPSVDPPRRSEPPVQRSEPQKDPPRRPDSPAQRSEPQRSTPNRDDSPKKSDPPPQKSEPQKSEPSKQTDPPTRKPRDTR